MYTVVFLVGDSSEGIQATCKEYLWQESDIIVIILMERTTVYNKAFQTCHNVPTVKKKVRNEDSIPCFYMNLTKPQSRVIHPV